MIEGQDRAIGQSISQPETRLPTRRSRASADTTMFECVQRTPSPMPSHAAVTP